MSSSSSQTNGSTNESDTRERSTTRDTSVTIESNDDGEQVEQDPKKKARKPPTKNMEASNGGKPWSPEHVSTCGRW
jgi:hypothetical protein